MKRTIIFLVITFFCYNSAEAKKYTYPNGNYYEGGWRYSEPDGQGVMHYANGDKYEGSWRSGNYNGKGILQCKNGNKFDGMWNFITFEGNANFVNVDGNIFTGSIKCNFYDSGKASEMKPIKFSHYEYLKGTMKYKNGDIYNGEWDRILPYKSGIGTMQYANGDKYSGEWKNDEIYGNGIMEYADSSKYEGKWVYNQWHGNGKYTKPDGTIINTEWYYGEEKTVVEKRKKEEKLQKELQKKENDKILLTKLKTEEAARIKRQTNKNKGLISGVITYSLNNFSRADIGAEVVVVKITPEMNIECIDMYNSLQTAKTYGNAKQFSDQLQESGVNYSTAMDMRKSIYGNDCWDDKSAISGILKYQGLESALKTAVDGVGKFDIAVDNGKYCVIITSKNVKKPSTTEVLGAIYIDFVIIENGGTKSVSHEFK